MARESKVELKVGIFVLIGVAFLFVLVFLIGDLSFMNPGWEMKAVFGFANGVKPASPVRLAGVDAGTVKDAVVFFDQKDQKNKVEISIWLKSGLKIPKDSKVWVNTLGLLGEKYIEIIPGTDYSEYLKAGDMIVGEDPISMEQITKLVSEIASKVETSVEEFNEIVEDDETKRSIKEMLAHLNSITRKIDEGQGTLGRFVNDDSIYRDLEILTDDLKKHPWKLIHRK
ncbi:MlaD family protein [Candidatus Omnitrophota bacterium]